MLVGFRLRRGLEHVRRKAVDDEATVPLFFEEPGVSEDPEVVGQGHHLDSQQFRQFADVFRSLPKRIDDPQAQGLAERLEAIGAEIGLQGIFGHCAGELLCWRIDG